MKGRPGTEPTDQDAECAADLVSHGRPQGRRQLAAVDGEPDHERPSGWEPSSVQGSGVRAARAAVLALAPLSSTSHGDHVAVDRAALLVDELTDEQLFELVPHLPALVWAEYDLDRYGVAHGHLDRALGVASRIRHRMLLPGLFLARAAVATRRGRLAEAVRDAQESAARARLLGLAGEHAFAVAMSLPARLWRHGPAAVRGPLATAAPPHTLPVAWWRPVAAVATAEVLLQLGRARTARAVAVTALDGGSGVRCPALLSLAATAELACGRPDAAVRLQHRAALAAEAGGLDFQCGLAGLAGARLLLSDRAHEEALDAAVAAAVRFERCGALVEAGRARLVAARAATGIPDHDRAALERRLATTALATGGALWLVGAAPAPEVRPAT